MILSLPCFSSKQRQKNCSLEFQFKLMEVWGRGNRQTNKEMFYIWGFSLHLVSGGFGVFYICLLKRVCYFAIPL